MRINKFVLGLFFVLLYISLISAIDLSIESNNTTPTILNDGSFPAKYNLIITNNGNSANFYIFTYEKFALYPDKFSLNKGESKEITLELTPFEVMKKNSGFISVPIYFRVIGEEESQKHQLTIELVDFQESFEIVAKNVDLDSDEIEISFYNVRNLSYDKLDVTFSSTFIPAKSMSFSILPYEKKTYKIPVDNAQLKKLVYGSYLVSARVEFKNYSDIFYTTTNIVERQLINENIDKKGLLIRRITLEKVNKGNIPTIVEIDARKSIISRLFTSFSIEPNDIERKGFYIYYTWKSEILPDEALSVKMTTNWILPFIIIAIIVGISALSYFYFSTHLIIKKKVKFVKTKSNDFALRVQINVKAKRFVENVRIYERLPAMAKVHEKFFGEHPSRLDKERGRMQWDISRLAEGEERTYSYIMYSKMKVVGKFELPHTTAIYDILGKVQEARSNKVFFINEPSPRIEEE